MKQVGVIGCGTWGSNHARTLSEIGALAGVSDLSRPAAERLATRLGTRAMEAEALLSDPGIDAVVIALSPGAQPEVARRAIAHGKPFLVEKPMALTGSEAHALAAEARAAGLVAMTGHVLIFHPAFEALVAQVREGAIGKLRHVQTQRWGFGRFLPQTDVAFDLFPHDLSMLRALIGNAPLHAELFAHRHLSDGADTAELVLAYPGAISAHCSASRISPLRERRIIVSGTHGSIVFDDMRDLGQKLALTPIATDSGQPVLGETRFLEVAQTSPLEAELRHFLSCVESGQTPRASLALGAEVITLLETLSRQTPTPATGATERLRP